MGQQQSFSGIAPKTNLTANVGITDTVISVASTTGYPNTAYGPFVITLDRGTQGVEEKCLCTAYTSSSMTVQRAYDGTTAVTHTAGSGTVEHTVDAAWHQDISSKLYAVNKGDLLYASAASSPAHLGIGSTGQFLRVASGLPAWAGLAATDIEALFTASGQIFVGTGVATGAITTQVPSVTISTSTSASINTSYKVSSGSPTITLPAPQAGCWVKVTNYGSGVPVVSHNSSEVIYGTGLGSAGSSSFSLGTYGATATLESDGTNWFITGGQADSGWLALSLLNSWANLSGFSTGAYRKIANQVLIKGNFTSGSTNTQLATLPTGFRPVESRTFPLGTASGTTGSYGSCSVTTAGAISVAYASSPAPSSIAIDGITFTVD